MKLNRAMELLNGIVDNTHAKNGEKVNETISELLDVGFTANELVIDFNFNVDDVENCVKERKEKGE